VRIPLDYYRILGLPIQATTEQLRQAHRDRMLQLPRREYSEAAIASRKTLLDEAFAVLSDSDQRQTYDAGFLAKTYELPLEPDVTLVGGDRFLSQTANGDTSSDPHTPSLEIQHDEFVGALLILQDLGEYELVLKLGRPFLKGGSASLKNGEYGDPSIVFADIVLTVALACLELGREQWQQGQYENAAEALETGQQLLLREGLFAGVRGEIQSDLYKLRPYRVLELLALSEDKTDERYQGMQLLQDMLRERGGIDGTENDQSGLTIDDFLRFIQQLRGYLTAAEQQVLFEEEARRPSAVATYLAVYALLARGFADRQPALVRRAKLLLLRLSSRQDVHLEQSVCSLLLGQTEEASRALDLSQEYGPIAFIREHSQGSPDLLPGLCLYAERWLQDEVFPHFRDLSRQRASLKDYFADTDVQEYLEVLPSEADNPEEWSVQRSRSGAFAAMGTVVTPLNRSRVPSLAAVPSSAFAGASAASEQRESPDALVELARARAMSMTSTATLAGDRPGHGAVNGTTPMPTAERVVQTASGSGRGSSRSMNDSDRPRRADGRTVVVPPRRRAEMDERSDHRLPRSKDFDILRFLLPGAVIAGMVLLGFLVAWLLRAWQTSATKPVVQTQTPSIPLERPVAVPPTPTVPSPTSTTLTNLTAQQVIQSWLTAKTAAMGPSYAIEQLDQALAEPKLSEWRNAAAEAKRDNWYKHYQHQIRVTAVEPNKANPDQVNVEAEVTEMTEYFVAGRLQDSTTDSNMRIRYSMIRKDARWLIQNWQLL